MDSVTVTGVGRPIGFTIGVVLAVVSTAMFRHLLGSAIHPVLRVETARLAVAATVAVGLAFDTYPARRTARRTARLSPVFPIAREWAGGGACPFALA